jgi:acyl-CoA synthetase (AMP-forming)/AMP-acid ligase II
MNEGLSTLRDLLSDRVRRRPNDLVYAFLAGEKLQNQWNYLDLHREVARIGAQLGAAGASGKRALLVYPQGLDFLAAFLACLCRNVVAVPVPAPETWNLLRTMPRLKAVAEDADAALVLTSRKVFSLASTGGNLWDFDHTPWIVTDEPVENAAESGAGLGDDPIDVRAPAYLQYTSGSTSSPSGVVITHQNLMHHLGALHSACGYGDGVTVTWMPHFHDYGLVQGLLQPLYSGDPCYFMSPLSFLKRPAHWLGAITRYQGTHSQAPNFAYDHCIRRTSEAERSGLDLSSWKAAGNAAEPINPEVLEKFIETFEPFGFRREAASPAYGLAEATLLVSSTRPNAGPRVVEWDADALVDGRVAAAAPGGSARKIVACGALVGDTKVAIVNPDSLARCRPDEVGEIWVSDPAVAAGYWNNPAKSKSIFGATLSDTGEGPWMRTGDLGFLNGGQLFISGRLKDMIIIRGANFAPQDIEWVSQRCHPAVESAESAAFPLMVDGAEHLGIVQELNRKDRLPDEDLENVAAKIREQISLEFDIRPYAVALVRRGTIPKTSSGKIQRRACRAALIDGGLSPIYEVNDGPLSPLGGNAK